MSDDRPKYLEVDRQLVGWCEEAVSQTFTNIFGPPVKLRDVQIEIDPIRGYEITAILPLMQSSLEGALAVSFPKLTLVNFGTQTYKLAPEALTDEMLANAAAEISHIVFNLLREKYNAQGFRFQPSFPVVVMGRSQAIYSLFPPSKLALHFDTVHGPCSVEVSAVQTV